MIVPHGIFKDRSGLLGLTLFDAVMEAAPLALDPRGNVLSYSKGAYRRNEADLLHLVTGLLGNAYPTPTSRP